MPHTANAPCQNLAAKFPVRNHLSGVAFNREGLWLADGLHMGSGLVMPAKVAGLDAPLRRH